MLEESLSGWDSVMKVALGGFYQKKKVGGTSNCEWSVYSEFDLKHIHTFYIKVIENQPNFTDS